MVDPKASRFWQVALQSGLIDAEGLQACFDAILPEKRVAEQLDRRLARQAVQQSRLTLWQAQQVLAGRSSGFKINRYTLLDMIGQGGMGRVYLARDTRLNRRVALKILSQERMNNPRAITRFQREARVGAQLQHENLVRIYDEGEANGKCYLVMEYIEGKNIGAIIAEDGPIPPATAARLCQQVALGLEHAQLKGLIHRDVNPYNILVTRDGIAKLTDLGLAIDQSEQAQVTREGATVGTFDYVSPEQARHSHSVDTRSDIYSLGCTLYHMLTSQVPFPSPSLPEKLFGHQAIEPEPVTTLVPDIPEGLSQIVQKMMRKSPDERYPTPLDVAQALERFTDVAPGSTFASPASSGIRGLGRSSMTETQVVDGPQLGSGTGMGQAVTQVVSHLVERSPIAPIPTTSSSSATRPSPIADPELAATEAPPPAQARSARAEVSASRPDEGWNGLGLGIDLGPEPSLTEGLQSRKKKSRSSSSEMAANTAPELASPAAATPAEPEPARVLADGDGLGLSLDFGPAKKARGATPAGKSGGAPAPTAAPASQASGRHGGGGGGRNRRWLIGAGALAAAAAVLGVLFGLGLIGKARVSGMVPSPISSSSAPEVVANGVGSTADDGGPVARKKPHGPTGTGTGTGNRPGAAKDAASKKGMPEVSAEHPIAIKTRDGQLLYESNLKSAMQRAIGSKGHVLLNNREPLRLTGADAAINIGGGSLYIRAAEGVRPVLEVEIKGQKPFLSTRTDTPLTIVGVRIVARYEGKPAQVPALIQAGGNVTLDRCAFTATGAVKGGRAVAIEGANLAVTGCWFEDFDTAIDVASFAGSTATIKQSMMVLGKAASATAADGPTIGWAVRVRRAPGGNTRVGRHLVMEHCTARGRGLLDLVDFSQEAPLRVEIKQCAVLADALLAWQTPKPGSPLTAEALTWKGEENQYDIRGQGWIVPAREGTTEPREGPTDLASWRAKMMEIDPVPPPIRFQVPLESLSDTPQPGDFGMIEQDVRTPGAEPSRVGPAL